MFTLIVVVLLVNAAFFVVYGVYKCYQVYVTVINGQAVHPGVEILATTDIFFLGIVLIVLAVGIAKLFMPGSFFRVDESAMDEYYQPVTAQVNIMGNVDACYGHFFYCDTCRKN